MAEFRDVAKYVIWNTIIGLVLLWLANLVWPQIGYPWWGLALTAIGGIPGVILTVLLKLLVVT